MIYYLSGTGNSAYVAHALGRRLGCDVLSLATSDPAVSSLCGGSLGLVFPVYSWGVPPIVRRFVSLLSDTLLRDVKERDTYIWACMTCGDEVAMAPEMLAGDFAARGLRLDACYSVIMPNNYVLLPGFDVDDKNVERQKLDGAPARVDYVGARIAARVKETDVTRGLLPGLKTRLVYPLFRRWGIFPKRWRWTPECVRCGKCSEVCPVGNVRMSGGRPKWGGKCISCLACYHVCPVHAVAYGGVTGRKGQYFYRRGN